MNRLSDYDPVHLHALLEGGATICTSCGDALAVDDGLCGDCFEEINGQFGVGA